MLSLLPPQCVRMPLSTLLTRSPPARAHDANAASGTSGAGAGTAKRSGVWARFKQRFTDASNRGTEFPRDSGLVGKTIDPVIATRYRRHLDLTGTGKILDVRNLSDRKCRVIEKHVITPLEVTPARGDTFRRTPGECVIDALAA